jgi:hypothetical protein
MSEEKIYTIFNRGVRTYTMRTAPDGTKRQLGPKESIVCLDEAEYKALSGNHDIVDADKIVPAASMRIDVLQKENLRMKQELIDLKTELGAMKEHNLTLEGEIIKMQEMATAPDPKKLEVVLPEPELARTGKKGKGR